MTTGQHVENHRKSSENGLKSSENRKKNLVISVIRRFIKQTK